MPDAAAISNTIGTPARFTDAQIASIKSSVFGRGQMRSAPVAQTMQGARGLAGAPFGRSQGSVGANVVQRPSPQPPNAPRPTAQPQRPQAPQGQQQPQQPQQGGGMQGLAQLAPLIMLLLHAFGGGGGMGGGLRPGGVPQLGSTSRQGGTF